MKHFLLFGLAALAFFVAAPSAYAVRVRVVDAPEVCAQNSACAITDPSTTYTMSFMPVGNALCQSATADPPGANIEGFNWCIVFTNFSGTALTDLHFSFTVPPQGPDDFYNFVECEGFPSSVTNSFCPPAPLHAGDNISMSFFANPGVPNAQSAYLFVDFLHSPGDAETTFASVSVPEPGALGLFGLGLLAIGYGLQKRRRSPRINVAA